MVGFAYPIIITVSTEDEQGELKMVHANVFVPKVNPVTVDNGLLTVVIVPLPEIKDHCPVPVNGVFADIVTEVPHTL